MQLLSYLFPVNVTFPVNPAFIKTSIINTFLLLLKFYGNSVDNEEP